MLSLVAVLLAVTTSPIPAPAATNPFTLQPLPRPSTLPVIGTTHNRPVCTAVRQAIKPALLAAMKNDAIYTSMRKTIFDYVVSDTEDVRNLRIVQMDKQIEELVKATDALDTAAASSAFAPASGTGPEDAKTLRELQASLKGVAAAQHVQLDAVSGFVETERARLFGKLDESQQQMQRANASTANTGSTPSPVTGFLADSQQAVLPAHRVAQGLFNGHLLDRDLGGISNFTKRREEVASRVITDAAERCR